MIFIFAIIPIIYLIIGLGVLKKEAIKVCSSCLLLTFILAITIFDQQIIHATQSIIEGTLFALWPICLIIVAAIFIHNLSMHSGALEIIKKILSSISSDDRIQILLLAWGFGGFLEAVAGYGTAVAIPIALLISLGHDKYKTVIICLIANTVAVAFGAVGIPVISLANVTGLDVMTLSHYISIQLAIFIIMVPFVLVVVSQGSLKAIKGVFLITLLAGVSFLIPEVYIASNVGPELAAIIGSLSSMLTIIIFCKIKKLSSPSNVKFIAGLKAWSPYIIVTFLIVLTSPIFPKIHQYFMQFASHFTIYEGPGATLFEVKWVLTPGIMMFIAAFFMIIIQKISFKKAGEILFQTIKSLIKTIVTIISIVSLSKVMGYSGMVDVIAVGIANLTGILYPFFATWIGGLGTFLTGSDTSSNILFGELQMQVANNLNLNQEWIVAANTTGAAIGKMISPQNIAIATAAANIQGEEGHILGQTFKYFVILLLIASIIIFAGALII